MKQDSSKNLLEAIYKNSRMATLAIDSIFDKFENKQLLSLIKKQNKKYEDITHQCEKIAKELGYEMGDVNTMAKMMSTSSINMKTFLDNSTSHIAKMMIEGTNLGIIDIIKKTGEFSSSRQEIVKLARDLQCAEEEFVDSLKTFLTK